jgi:hypothetical protein
MALTNTCPQCGHLENPAIVQAPFLALMGRRECASPLIGLGNLKADGTAPSQNPIAARRRPIQPVRLRCSFESLGNPCDRECRLQREAAIAKRAGAATGVPLAVVRDNDKNTVAASRGIPSDAARPERRPHSFHAKPRRRRSTSLKRKRAVNG